jgi:hypothetical protein
MEREPLLQAPELAPHVPPLLVLVFSARAVAGALRRADEDRALLGPPCAERQRLR